MKTKRSTLFLGLNVVGICAALVACATPPPQPIVVQRPLPPALSEVFRNGELKGLEQNTSGILGIPNDSELVQRVCVSKPHFNLYGQYVTTLVKCY